MAELTDDFGSDAETYEDALEELETEEQEYEVANVEKSSVSEPNVHLSNSDTQRGEHTELNRDEKSETESSTNSTDSDEEEEGDHVSKAYCDIPADPSEEGERVTDALHQRLNEQIDSDKEEEVDDDEVEKVNDIYYVDEEAMKKLEETMSDEEKQAKREEAQLLKAEGNDKFKAGEFVPATESYTQALRTSPLCYAKDRSIMYSNRAACHFYRELYDACTADCTRALELNPDYLKALHRRALSYEKSEKLEQALEDYQAVLTKDPSYGQAREACMRLPEQIKEKNEKLKAEMMDKLKDLGNMVLRPFGLSTNNFNLVQNPDTGSYSVNFNNSPLS